MASISEIAAEMSKQLQPINENIQQINENFLSLSEELKSYKEKCKKMETEIDELKTSVEILNKKLIKKNLIIMGVTEKENENLREIILHLFKETLHINDITIAEIDEAYRLGKVGTNYPRAVKLSLSTNSRKSEIMKKVTALRGTNISIQNELTKKDIEDRKKLKPFLIKAKNEGLTAKFVHNKLKIGKDIYNTEEIEKLSTSNSQIRINSEGRDKATDSDEEDTLSQYSTPDQNKNNPNNANRYTAFSRTESKRKEISPLAGNEDTLYSEVQKLRSEPFSKKKTNQTTLPQSFFRQNK